MKRLITLLLITSIALNFCACRDEIADETPDVSEQTTVQSNVPDNIVSPITTTSPEGDEKEAVTAPEKLDAIHIGSYLTMFKSSGLEFPYVKVFRSYKEVSEYYERTAEDFFYGAKFTLTCASFNEQFFSYNDVLMLVLEDTTSYVSFKNSMLLKTDGKIEFIIERHLMENAPLSKTQYHLIFTAPKGAFDSENELEIDLKLYDVIDNKSNDTFDTERYITKYPEYWPFTYRCDASGSAQMVIDTIQSYHELISFYEQYKGNYDLESEFKKHIGTLYDEHSYFNDYLMVALILPTKSQSEEIAVDELFVYNRELYLSVKNTSETTVSQNKTECYLLMVSVAKKDLEGVNLEWCNISLN